MNDERNPIEGRHWLNETPTTQPALPGMKRSEPKPPGMKERDRGMERVAISAGEDWMSRAFLLVRVIATNRSEFTADDVHRIAGKALLNDAPDPRAWGPVMMKASKAGLISKTGRYVSSSRPACHRRPIPVYRSLIVGVSHEDAAVL